jgi:hypothetical protein
LGDVGPDALLPAVARVRATVGGVARLPEAAPSVLPSAHAERLVATLRPTLPVRGAPLLAGRDALAALGPFVYDDGGKLDLDAIGPRLDAIVPRLDAIGPRRDAIAPRRDPR